MNVDVLVVGAGYAGLCASWRLGLRGLRVLCVEAEPMVATHASARNAAIWLPFDDEASTGPLGRASESLLDALCGRPAWLRPRRALVTASDEAHLEPRLAAARACDRAVVRRTREQLHALCPILEEGGAWCGFEVLEAGELDPAAMCEAVRRAAVGVGVAIRTGQAVVALQPHHPEAGVAAQLQHGEWVRAQRAILAAGAWSARLAERIGLGLPLVPLRRHLAVIDTDSETGGTMVWHLDPECYFRPEPGGVLASGCDEEPFEPGLPPVSQERLDEMARRLCALSPRLAPARVRRSWACLRTFAPDRELVVGPDPRAPAIVWFAGFGGRGMTVAPGAAEELARWLHGGP
ncbi:MAG: FAD-dependent oxidoreductase, partial [Myxococcales bacterium]|nr:FAD-dependent oxidoreductase [Myxococcales bacterium]